MKQILAVIALNQLETKVNNLQMCIIRSRFQQVLWKSPFAHANFLLFRGFATFVFIFQVRVETCALMLKYLWFCKT